MVGKWLFVLVVAFIITLIKATPSVFSCPGQGNILGLRNNVNLGLGGGLGGPGGLAGLGEICGTGSLLHYWRCCDDNPYLCCLQFEVWFV
uniref:Secreted protein n=1 Tax=Rhabditophanes sp. KR3021 TaxID=114890 RepID=A0AC35UAC3_9BILA